MTSSSTYEETHENKNSSTIKTVLDTFYEEKLDSETTVDSAGNKYSAYLSDTLFCNDRSVYSGTGIGNTTSLYNARDRLYINKIPSLICTNQNDEFTVKVMTLGNGTTVGNGDLTYPIGLITADEVAMAGGVYNITNITYYLYMGRFYWSMTPHGFSGTNALELYVNSTGGLLNVGTEIVSGGVRPVINISSSVLVESGTGKQDDPYILKLNL